jgi:glycosyltransferase involved in cell wall biosynthesis
MIVFMYGIEVWEPLRPLRRWALRRAKQLIAISRFTAHKAIRANGLPPRKIRILNNCLDPQLVTGIEASGGETSLSLLTVARLPAMGQYKGHDLVIKALPALLRRFPELTYRIVGDGEGRSLLENLAGQLGVTKAVRFYGVVPDEELRRHYTEASVFIMPSRQEGFGFVFLEAMALGTPAIGGNQDATPEVIVHDQTGLLVDPCSVEDIIRATTTLLENRELRDKMGQAAACHARQHFGFESFRHKLLDHLSGSLQQTITSKS